MGIQPIDLQVMYQQSANVSKIAGSAQAAQLSDSIMQQTTVARQNLENAAKVQSTNDDKARNPHIDDNSNGGNSGYGTGKRKNQASEDEESENEMNPAASDSKPSYLGSIIDIFG